MHVESEGAMLALGLSLLSVNTISAVPGPPLQATPCAFMRMTNDTEATISDEELDLPAGSATAASSVASKRKPGMKRATKILKKPAAGNIKAVSVKEAVLPMYSVTKTKSAGKALYPRRRLRRYYGKPSAFE